ncbi:MAG: hypothetical protein ABIQ59_17565 [Nocardioidaceae bacterium]
MVHVEVRDTSLADAPATMLAAGRVATRDGAADVVLDVPDHQPVDRTVTVWARVAIGGSAATAVGDWVTTQSYPLDDSGSASVAVRRVS